MDAQTEEGKGPAGIAKLAKEAGKPVIAIAGRVEDGAEKMFDQCLSLCSLGLGPSECMARAAELDPRQSPGTGGHVVAMRACPQGYLRLGTAHE